MKEILEILKRFLLELIRNKSNLGFMIVLPIVFMLVFGVVPGMSSSQTLVDAVNQDGSAMSQAIIQEINQQSGYTVHVVSTSQAKTDLRNLQAGVVITLPKGMEKQVLAGKPLPMKWQASPNAGGTDNITGLMNLQGKIDQWTLAGSTAVQKARVQNSKTAGNGQKFLEQAFIRGMKQSSSIKNLVTTKGVYLSQGQVQRQTLSDAERSTIGFATMFIIFTVFGSTGSIYRERVRGTWNRLKASPVSKAQILTGYGIGFFLVGWLQFFIMDATGAIFFGKGVPITPWAVVIISLYVLAIVGIALCIASVVKSMEQHMMTGSFIAVATSMLGGAYWPLDLEPTWMQKIALFVPQSWAIDAFKVNALGLASLSSALVPLCVLTGFALVFFGAGILQLRYS